MNLVVMKLLAVATGGALGASFRYLLAAMTHQLLGHHFPYGTLMVNFIGSALIGYLVVLLPETEGGASLLRLLLITGLLGGFTTYSAFSIETLHLLQQGQITKAGLNIVSTLLACLFAVWLGWWIARSLHGTG